MPKRPGTTASEGGVPAPTKATATPNEGHAASEAPTMTPAAALARHIDWLEYALGAARAEETARAGRLEAATKKNREKRTTRLAEARDEVAELTALLAGIRDLQAKARGSRTTKPASPRPRTPAPKTPRRRAAAGTASGA